jgi:uncharacterized phiE125 gp8 family phage protein
MAIKVVSPPTEEPISRAEAKSHIRDDLEDDSYVEDLIKTARKLAETYTWHSLAVQTFEYSLDNFPSGEIIRLPRPPTQSVDSITYKDRSGNVTTIDPADYVLDGEYVVLNSGKSWPSFDPFPVNAVRIQFTSGYTELPDTIKEGMLLLIGHWYNNREAAYVGSVTHQMAFAVESLLLPHRWE